MKNIFRIIASDIHRMSINVVAVIVVMGLSVLPCLYAWFNIISNWDPYGPDATKNLQVAVASDDEGVVLGGMELNVGDMIVSNLKENETIGWVFPETSGEAVDGVYSGDYYACLVIDEKFSSNLISFLGGDIENPTITYYENEKKNAIAPKITGKVKTTVQREVDAAFISTMAGVLINSSTALVTVDSEGNLTQDSIKKLEQLDNDMKAVVMILDSYIALLDASSNMMTATEAAADSATATMDAAESMMAESDAAIDAATEAVEATGQVLSESIKIGGKSIKRAQKMSDALLDAGETSAKKLADSTDTAVTVVVGAGDANGNTAFVDTTKLKENASKANGELATATARYAAAEKAWKDAGEPESGPLLEAKNKEAQNVVEKKAAADAANAALAEAEKANATAVANSAAGNTTLGKDLRTLQQLTRKQAEDVTAVNNRVKASTDATYNSMEDLAAAYNNSVAPQLEATSRSANNSIALTKKLLNHDTTSLDAVARSLDSYPDMISQSRDSLVSARNEAAEMERKLAILTGNVDSFSASEESDILYKVMSTDSDYLAEFISSPVNIDEQYIYPVENNGSASASFYIVLSIWVGSLIMSTILKTTVKNTTGMTDLRNWQVFVGRYFTTFVIGQIQTIITVLGALLYVGIQCEHPFLFWVACSWTSFVFSLLLYSFTYAFGNVGEALSVILMVIQVAGSGGTFPVEVLPKVFQYLYALMPFKYAMNACRECVAGFYNHDYIIDLICLIPFIALAVINGLFLFFPMRKLNAQIEKSKEKSGILI